MIKAGMVIGNTEIVGKTTIKFRGNNVWQCRCRCGNISNMMESNISPSKNFTCKHCLNSMFSIDSTI